MQGAIGGDVYKRDFNGYYAYLVQNIGTTDQLVLKYDVLNPNTNVSTSDFRAGTNLSVSDLKYTTIGLGLVHHWDDNVKFIFYYELISNDKLDPALATSAALLPYVDNVRDNVLTLRVQYKF